MSAPAFDGLERPLRDHASPPLEGLRVLELTVARAGPTAGRQLADWGADVVRIEPPMTTPDADHSFTGDRRRGDYQNLHRGKRSIVLDLKAETGKARFRELLSGVDVVIENMRPEVKFRLGVDYETVKSINPRIVYGSISGFGQDGPYATRGGVDQIAQGMGGLMSITGEPGSAPMRVGVPIADIAAGLHLAFGIVVALYERERSGMGQWVHTSLLESVIHTLDFQAARWTVDGEVPLPEGNHHPTSVPMGCFQTADGWINIAGPAGRLYGRFCEAAGLDDLRADPKFVTAASRSTHRHELNERVAAKLLERTTADWLATFVHAGVPAGPVYRIDEAMADEQVRHLGMEKTVVHPTLGELSLIRNPVQMSRTPHCIRGASPEPGEHTLEVCGEPEGSSPEPSAVDDVGVA